MEPYWGFSSISVGNNCRSELKLWVRNGRNGIRIGPRNRLTWSFLMQHNMADLFLIPGLLLTTFTTHSVSLVFTPLHLGAGMIYRVLCSHPEEDRFPLDSGSSLGFFMSPLACLLEMEISVKPVCDRVCCSCRFEGHLDLCPPGMNHPSFSVNQSILEAVRPRLKDFHQLLLEPPKVWDSSP